MWELPVENAPIIPAHQCDAHWTYLRQQRINSFRMPKALDLDFDGLMIESHRDPDNAWSDASANKSFFLG